MTDQSHAPIAFIDLKAQQSVMRAELDAAIAGVLDHGGYLHGKEVHALEAALAARANVQACIACSSGTDALLMVLMAEELGPRDAVIVPAFTFVATAEAVVLAGATPVFADIDAETYNLTPETLEAAIAHAKSAGLTPRGVIAVDLFGLPAPHHAIAEVAAQHRLFVLDDMAQAFGSKLDGVPLGGFGKAAATSFYPAKPLGCYGDGGAVFTNDEAYAAILRSIRQHGELSRYENDRIGITGRIDTIQAAVLGVKLRYFDDELAARDRIASAYTAALAGVIQTPVHSATIEQAWAQYTVRCDSQAAREHLRAICAARNIPTQIYYPIALADQKAYAKFPSADISVARHCTETVLSLPFHPYLSDAQMSRVIEAVHTAFPS